MSKKGQKVAQTPYLERVPLLLFQLGNRGRPGTLGCHEESEARVVKVHSLTSSASQHWLKKLLYPWLDPPIPLLLISSANALPGASALLAVVAAPTLLALSSLIPRSSETAPP